MDILSKLSIDRWQAQIAGIGWLELLRLTVEVLIIVYAAVWIFVRIRGTQAERLVKGVLVLTFICIVSAFAGFSLVTSILQQVIPVAVLALLIVFQPEIRRGLGYLGRSSTFKIDLSLSGGQQDISRFVVEQIITAVRELARTRTGALIVVEPLEGERDYLSPGIPVNADVSSTLILSLFYPNSPLHDGAVIIRGDKIVAAGVILRMSDNPNLSYRYGTRHRAAIGLSEIYDGLCIVVSEETGFISAASHGMLLRYENAEELTDPLSYIYQIGSDSKAPNPLQLFLAMFSRKSRQAGATAGSGGPAAAESARMEKKQPDKARQPDKETPGETLQETS